MEIKTYEIALNRHHLWCQHCGASIKQDAKYCRFCQEDKGAEVAIAYYLSSPEAHFEECRHWLPKIDDLVGHLPDCDYKLHLLQGMKTPDWLAQAEISANEKKQYHESNIGLSRPIAPAGRALIFELLCGLHGAGIDLKAVLDSAKLRVLDVGKTAIEEELALRAKEVKSKKSCPFCAEAVTNDAKLCRHCGSDFKSKPPKASIVDAQLLREVVLHLAVQEAVSDSGVPKKVSALLTKLGIKKGDVEKAAKTRRYEVAEGVQPVLPRSNWLSRVLKEQLGDGLEDYHALHDMLTLGGNLRAEKRFEEAELVVNYTMRLAQDYKNRGSAPGTERLLTGLIRNCTQQLSLLYEDSGRFAEAEHYHVDFANETDFSCIPELNKAFQAMAESIAPSSLIRLANLSAKQSKLDEAEDLYLRALATLDPIEEERPVEVDHQDCNEILSQLKGALGEFSSMSQSQTQRPVSADVSEDLEGTPLIEMNRRLHILNGLADIYLAKNDLDKAQEILADAMQAISKLSADRWLPDKVEIWSRLAEVYSRQHKYDQAKPLLKEAIESLEKLAGNRNLRPRHFAELLSDLKKRLTACSNKIC
jgi:tetratricopeptide (TPR) repeat protein/RNA polymerase subunit RPABC4/transcription elongation factor Spt4